MTSEADIRLYTISEVAKFMGLSQRTIQRWIKAGKLPVVRLGRQVRIKQDDVVALIRRHEVGSPRPTTRGTEDGESLRGQGGNGRLLALLEAAARLWQPGEGIQVHRLRGVRGVPAFRVVGERQAQVGDKGGGYPTVTEALQAWLEGVAQSEGQPGREEG